MNSAVQEQSFSYCDLAIYWLPPKFTRQTITGGWFSNRRSRRGYRAAGPPLDPKPNPYQRHHLILLCYKSNAGQPLFNAEQFSHVFSFATAGLQMTGCGLIRSWISPWFFSATLVSAPSPSLFGYVCLRGRFQRPDHPNNGLDQTNHYQNVKTEWMIFAKQTTVYSFVLNGFKIIFCNIHQMQFSCSTSRLYFCPSRIGTPGLDFLNIYSESGQSRW